MKKKTKISCVHKIKINFVKIPLLLTTSQFYLYKKIQIINQQTLMQNIIQYKNNNNHNKKSPF